MKNLLQLVIEWMQLTVIMKDDHYRGEILDSDRKFVSNEVNITKITSFNLCPFFSESTWNIQIEFTAYPKFVCLYNARPFCPSEYKITFIIPPESSCIQTYL